MTYGKLPTRGRITSEYWGKFLFLSWNSTATIVVACKRLQVVKQPMTGLPQPPERQAPTPLAPIAPETHYSAAIVARPTVVIQYQSAIALAKTGIVVWISLNRNTVAIECALTQWPMREGDELAKVPISESFLERERDHPNIGCSIVHKLQKRGIVMGLQN